MHEVIAGTERVIATSDVADVTNYKLVIKSGPLTARADARSLIFENDQAQLTLSAGKIVGILQGHPINLATDCQQNVVDTYLEILKNN